MDRGVAILGSELFQGKTSPSLVSEVDPLKCLWLTARNNISKARYVNMRLALLKHVKLAPYSFLRELRMAITPQLHTWPLNCAPEEQRGVYAELGEAIRIVVQRMIQFGSGAWMPCCNHEGNSCSNLVAKIHCSGDGRGDEKQYSQRSQTGMDTSHVLSFVFTVSSIAQSLPVDEKEPSHPTLPSVDQTASTSLLYNSSEILPELRRCALDEEGIRVWTIAEDLEEIYQGKEEPVSKRQRLAETDGSSTDVVLQPPKERSELEELAASIKKPLGFQRTGDTIWKEQDPQSSRAAHPWIITVERECNENVRPIFDHIINPQVEERRSHRLIDNKSEERRTSRKSGRGAGQAGDQQRSEDLQKSLIMVAVPCGHIISISTDIDVSGMDSKMIRSNNGRTGSFCYLCRTSRAEAHDLAIVERGFFCDMSAEDLIEKIEDWMGEVPREEWENYEFVSARGDEKVRFVVKHAPFSTVVDTVHCYAVLHTGLLRLFGWFEQLLIRLASDCPWNVGALPPLAKQRKENAEEEWKGEKLGPLIGFRHLRAPNQVTGNMVKVFFSEERRGEVLEAVGSLKAWQLSRGRDMTVEEKENLRLLLQRLNVINRVMSSDSVVKIMDFRSFCLETYSMILRNFPKASITETVHRLLSHSWEFMVLNNNCGLLRYGEGGSESMHHVERANRQHGSRKVSLMKGNEDTFRLTLLVYYG